MFLTDQLPICSSVSLLVRTDTGPLPDRVRVV
jgi:hypothetical protein